MQPEYSCDLYWKATTVMHVDRPRNATLQLPKGFFENVLHKHTRSIFIIICPTSLFIYPPTHVFSLLYLLDFYILFLWPRHGQCCEYWVRLFTETVLLFTLFHAVARGREREVTTIHLIGSFCLLCCDRASVISSHIVQDMCSFTLSMLRLENPKRKFGPVLVRQEIRHLLKIRPYQQQLDALHILRSDPTTITVQGKFYRSLCFTNHNDFNLILSECHNINSLKLILILLREYEMNFNAP